MDSYPGDLLAGVFPLVFAVNAILPEDAKENAAVKEKEETNDESNDQSSSILQEQQLPPPPPSKNRGRGLFDHFLDAMAASLADAEDDEEEERPKSVSSFLSHNSSSSDEDDSIGSGRKRRSFGMASPRVTQTRLGVLRGSIRSNQVDTPLSTAYARAGPQGFFERARIVSVSTRHGFPPSKDAEGNQNKAFLSSKTKNNISFGSNAHTMQENKNVTIDGILPAGWLEKHVHALPSVLLVVTCFDHKSPKHQQLQNDYVRETIQHLRYSLAPKRECRIQLVCLASADATVLQTDEWVSEIKTTCSLTQPCVTVLDTQHDLQGADSPGIPTSPGTRKLHKTVRDASLAYYLAQARRNKRKHGMLGYEQRPFLLPLAVRYCFKIAIFYEFLQRHEKSTRYFAQAYRHLEFYYRHVVLSRAPLPIMVNPQGDDSSFGGDQQQEESDEEGGVEVTLANSPTSESTRYAVGEVANKSSDPPSDMRHQCRGVADWLNLKLLQAGFLSPTENGGLAAAASQWRRHCLVFLATPDKTNPRWNHWAFVAHQRLVMAQLTERRPLLLRESSTDVEVQWRCSAWRNYEAAAEAMLRLGAEVHKANKELDKTATQSSDNMRPPFVGGTDSEGLVPKFRQECKRQHKEQALELALHAVALFENELKKESESKDKDETEPAPDKETCRAGARLYYLTGGILLEMKRYEEAALHLEKASLRATGWGELELAIRRMLIECYENHLPSQTEATDEQRENVTGMILDSYFNSQMSSQNLRRAIDNFSSLNGPDECLKWHRECTDESDSSMPFSFTVTFPGGTHATSGDVVTAIVTIKSNLDYAVHVNSVTLLSMAGRIPVPSSDLLCAKNANDGSNGGIIIQAKSAIFVTTSIDVPKDVESIASDDSGNGGEAEGTPGKGSFAKSARPRAAGLSSAGGARLVDERTLDGNRQERNAQWSLRFLGGKPLRCDAMSLVFYPVHAEKAAADGSRLNLIDLTIVHKKPKTHAPIRKTPFEEDNYISSAWSRPQHLPLNLGPRCLRVLGPMSQMIVTDLTNPLTNGIALEGTVNRILLKLQAGAKEECWDIKYRIACSNTSLSIDGTTRRLDPEDDQPSFDKKASRTPVLISSDEGPSSSNDCSFELPSGWHIVGSGQGTSTEVMPTVSSLSPSESTYIYLDLYRPPAQLVPISGPNAGDSDLCQTDYDIAITYRQSRPSGQNQGRRRRSAVGRVDYEDTTVKASNLSDMVFLEYSGSVLWTSPIAAEFSSPSAGPKAFPAGNSHPSNVCNESNSNETEAPPSVAQSSEVALVNGECISTRCVLTSNAATEFLGSEISTISFENNDGHSDDDETSCDLQLVSDGSDVIFRQDPNVACIKLIPGSKFNLAYAVDARIRSQYEDCSITACLGVICVDWKPVGLPLPEDVPRIEGQPIAHGPLVLNRSSRVKFRGPRFYMETAPFEASLDTLPAAPRIGEPFEVRYRVTNNTALNQQLAVSMIEAKAEGNGTGNDMSEGVLLSGLVSGEICLAPNETQTLVYTALATRAGKMEIPAISVSSLRYRTWVVHDPPANHRCVFVLP